MNFLQTSFLKQSAFLTSTLVGQVPSLVGSLIQQRFMSKYLSKAAAKRVPLNTKRAGKGYYKGKGATKEGRLTSKARFIVDPQKRLELIVPDLEGFKVNVLAEIVSKFTRQPDLEPHTDNPVAPRKLNSSKHM